MRPLHAVVLGALGLSLVAAGCGGAIPSSDGGPATLKLVSSTNGMHLADQAGRALYVFEKDESGESYCNGACAAVWPPLETSSMPHGGTGVQGAALGTIKRDNGDTQVTYHGHPLYYYAGDASTPGRMKGQEVTQFGAEWYLVGADGKPVESKATSKTSKSHPRSNSGTNSGTTTGSSSGGGGWG